MTDIELEEQIRKKNEVIEIDAVTFYDIISDASLIEQTFLTLGGLCEVKAKSEKAGDAVERACNRIESIISMFTESREKE